MTNDVQELQSKVRRYRIATAIIIMVVFAAIWFKGCNSKDPVENVTLEKKGTFEAVTNPLPVPSPEKVYVTRWKDREVKTPYPLNQELYELYVEALEQNDSLAKSKQLQMYADAIQEKTYSNDFDNKDVFIKIESKTRGDLLSVKPTYAIKPQKVEETYLRVLGGVELGNTLQFSNPVFKGNLLFQNKSGDIFSGSYDAQGTIYVGFNKSILNLKK